MYRCQCDCGNIGTVRSSNLRDGRSSSCGCLAKELVSLRSKTHGMSNSRIFGIWAGMIARCYSPGDYHYKWYGARGIDICDEWRDCFQNFYDWSIKNGYDESKSIDRIDNNKGYCPNNCRWASYKEQMRNTSRNHMICYDNQERCLTEWAEIAGIPESTFRSRMKRGWSMERIMNTPLTRYSTGTILVTYGEKTMTIHEWSKLTGIPTKAIKYRLGAGWDVGYALYEPVNNRRIYAGKVDGRKHMGTHVCHERNGCGRYPKHVVIE